MATGSFLIPSHSSWNTLPAVVDYAFGFGQRVPPHWMAHAFIWVVVVSVHSVFRIEKEKVVRDGCIIEPTPAFSPGLLACVLSPGLRYSLMSSKITS